MEEAFFDNEKTPSSCMTKILFKRVLVAVQLGRFGDKIHTVAWIIARLMIKKLRKMAIKQISTYDTRTSSILNSIGVFMMAALGGDEIDNCYTIKKDCILDLSKPRSYHGRPQHQLLSEVSILQYDYKNDWSFDQEGKLYAIKNFFKGKYKKWFLTARDMNDRLSCIE